MIFFSQLGTLFFSGFMPPGFSPMNSPVKVNSRGNVRGEAVHGANIPMITELGKATDAARLCVFYATRFFFVFLQ